MADIAVTAANVRPANLTQCVIRRHRAGATITPGQWVYTASDGDVEPTDADALASAQGIGMAVAGEAGTNSFPAGEYVDVVHYGPVVAGAGMTPGALIYASTTAGAGDHTAPASAGDYPFALGRAESATIVFVNPQAHAPVVNS